MQAREILACPSGPNPRTLRIIAEFPSTAVDAASLQRSTTGSMAATGCGHVATCLIALSLP